MQNHDHRRTSERRLTNSSIYNPGGTVTVDERSSFRDTVLQSSVEGDHVHPNDYSVTCARVEGPFGTAFSRGDEPRSGWWSQALYEGALAEFSGALPVPPLPWDDSLYNVALGRLNGKVRGNLDLAVSLAEAGSTFRMLNVVRSARRYALNPKWSNLAQKGNNAYLEFIYGWSPLISDIYGAANEMLNVTQARLGDVFSASAKSREDAQPLGITMPVFGFLESRTTGILKRLCRIEIALDLSGVDIARWSTFNPVAVQWATVPYSFVVDWFYDIGSYLRDWETALIYGTSFRRGFVVQSAIQSTGHTWEASSSGWQGNTYMTYGLQAIGRSKQTYHSRRNLSSYPLPDLPSFNADLGSSQILSLGALVGQRVFGRKPSHR